MVCTYASEMCTYCDCSRLRPASSSAYMHATDITQGYHYPPATSQPPDMAFVYITYTLPLWPYIHNVPGYPLTGAKNARAVGVYAYVS